MAQAQRELQVETEMEMALVQWMHAKGFAPGKNVSIQDFEGTGRGLVAESPIEPNVPFLFIPELLIVTSLTVDNYVEKTFKRKDAAKSLSEHQLLALFLSIQKNNPSNDYSPFMHSIPPSFDTVGHKIPKDILQHLPSDIRNMVAEQRRNLKSDWTAVSTYLDGLVDVTYDVFEWAWSAVNTRCVSLNPQPPPPPSAPPQPRTALIPLFDMLNHSPSITVHAHFNTSTRTFTLSTDARTEPGSQVFISYGPHEDARLLVEYGFIVGESNHFNCVKVDDAMGVPEEKVKRALEVHGMWGDYTLDGEDVSLRVLNALRLRVLVAMDLQQQPRVGANVRVRGSKVNPPTKDNFESLLKEWKRVLNGEIEYLSVENEKKVYAALKRICENVLDERKISLDWFKRQREDYGSSGSTRSTLLKYGEQICRTEIKILQSSQRLIEARREALF
ncbi:hypothetical protein BJ742DRAFT_532446 [Cladochytrium replicatum]|nr:hypothetical protein BJ742DRAFT_532446 [Cladochytrium replicatum]